MSVHCAAQSKKKIKKTTAIKIYIYAAKETRATATMAGTGKKRLKIQAT